MSKLVIQYKIPGMGKIKVFKSTIEQDTKNGDYFSMAECYPSRLYGESVEEAENSMLDQAGRYLRACKKSLQKDLETVEEGFNIIKKRKMNKNNTQPTMLGGNK